MTYVKNDDVRGAYLDDDKVLCADCIGDLADFREKNLIFDADVENADGTYYCDECEKAL